MISDKYLPTRVFHWVSALLLINLLAAGFYMADGNDYSIYHWHKSLGVIALVFVMMRLYHRYQHTWPSIADGSTHQWLVNCAHNLLLACSILMPISGLIYSGFGGYGVSLFNIVIIPDNYTISGDVIPFSATLSNLGKQTHTYTGFTFVALLSAHIIAALKHHFVDKDLTLKRMMSKRYTQSETV
ncbi:cytochrome b/b6 domain-containing protein [Thalassotalea sp. G2M2-11]|uniref:cytochrome b n=1 Tax=Thalassotalea sp. G2M2-11 TaxID=2787627 RepID=UPI0019D17767|nr:cytochrome b/b6 domain-containing protein [Thalassotalea sp. G2M2-11]